MRHGTNEVGYLENQNMVRLRQIVRQVLTIVAEISESVVTIVTIRKWWYIPPFMCGKTISKTSDCLKNSGLHYWQLSVLVLASTELVRAVIDQGVRRLPDTLINGSSHYINYHGNTHKKGSVFVLTLMQMVYKMLKHLTHSLRGKKNKTQLCHVSAKLIKPMLLLTIESWVAFSNVRLGKATLHIKLSVY